jgi:hypothetical protein
MLSGNIPGTIRQAADRIMRGLNERQSEELTKLLTNTNQAELLPILDRLQKAKRDLNAGKSVQDVLRLGAGIVGAQQAPRVQ